MIKLLNEQNEERKTLPESIQASLRAARREGRIMVPTIAFSKQEDVLALKFMHVSTENPEGEGRISFIPVFTSVEDLQRSGLPDDTRFVSPSPSDLAEIVGHEQWVAVNPGQDSLAIRIKDFVALWNSHLLD